MIKFTSILSRYVAAEFPRLEAAAWLRIGERTFRRRRRRYADEGEAPLLDRQLCKSLGKRVPSGPRHEVEALYRNRYALFTAKHFHEHLVKDHEFAWGYTWTKTFLYARGLALEGQAARRASAQARPTTAAWDDAAPALRRAREDQSMNGSAESRRSI